MQMLLEMYLRVYAGTLLSLLLNAVITKKGTYLGTSKKDEAQIPDYYLFQRQQPSYWRPFRNHQKMKKKTLIRPDYWKIVCLTGGGRKARSMAGWEIGEYDSL
ncbi:spexin isoform X3 [Macaca mulatta]